MQAHAIANRWNEELELVENEMLWTWICFQKKHLHWKDTTNSAQLLNFHGKAAFSQKQAYMWKKMAEAANASFKKVKVDFEPCL